MFIFSLLIYKKILYLFIFIILIALNKLMKIYFYFNLLFITKEMILKNKDVNILHKN